MGMTPRNIPAQLQGLYFNMPGGFFSPVLGAGEAPAISAKHLSVNGTVTLTGNTAFVTFPAIQKKCRIMGFRAICQESTSQSFVLYNGANSLGGLSFSSSGDVQEASIISPSLNASTLAPGDVLRIQCNKTGSSVPVSLQITVVPIGNT